MSVKMKTSRAFLFVIFFFLTLICGVIGTIAHYFLFYSGMKSFNHLAAVVQDRRYEVPALLGRRGSIAIITYFLI